MAFGQFRSKSLYPDRAAVAIQTPSPGVDDIARSPRLVVDVGMTPPMRSAAFADIVHIGDHRPSRMPPGFVRIAAQHRIRIPDRVQGVTCLKVRRRASPIAKR